MYITQKKLVFLCLAFLLKFSNGSLESKLETQEYEIALLKSAFTEMKMKHENDIRTLTETFENKIRETESGCKKDVFELKSIISVLLKEFNKLVVKMSNLPTKGKHVSINQPNDRRFPEEESVSGTNQPQDQLFTEEKSVSGNNQPKDRLFTEKESVSGNITSTHLTGPTLDSKGRKPRRKQNIRNIGGGNTKVAFDAHTDHDITNLGRLQTIKFNAVSTNLGKLYNPASGVFYCDTPGTYVFFFRVLTYPGKAFYVDLVKNGEVFSYLYSYDGEALSSASTLAIQHLQRGDSVWVQTHSHQSSTLTGKVLDHVYNSFSGFLLYPDDA